jgi:DNA transformation protein and related proteins
MSLSDEDIAYVKDLFSGLGQLSTRKMFGGVSLYHENTIFALMRSDGVVLLKGVGDFIELLEAEGCMQWTHTKPNGVTGTMPYWTLPDPAMDDPDLACEWALRALSHL